MNEQVKLYIGTDTQNSDQQVIIYRYTVEPTESYEDPSKQIQGVPGSMLAQMQFF